MWARGRCGLEIDRGHAQLADELDVASSHVVVLALRLQELGDPDQALLVAALERRLRARSLGKNLPRVGVDTRTQPLRSQRGSARAASRSGRLA
jgi:hypothetical protein